MLSVREYAEAKQLSPARVYQLLEKGKIPAVRVGRAWVIDDAALRREPAVRRPLSPVMAHLVLDALAGRKPAEVDSRRWLRAVAHAREIQREKNPAPLLRALMANRGEQLNLRVQPDSLSDLRADPRVKLSGISDARSMMDAGRHLEAHVHPADFAALRQEYMLIPHRESNVRLHISARSVRVSDSIADLADWAGPREDGEVVRMIAENLFDDD